MYTRKSLCANNVANASKPLAATDDFTVSRCPPDGQLVLAAVHVAAVVVDTHTHDCVPSEPSASEYKAQPLGHKGDTSVSHTPTYNNDPLVSSRPVDRLRA